MMEAARLTVERKCHLDRSLAIWCDHAAIDGQTEPIADLHFNLWRVRNPTRQYSESVFLDIGIKIDDPKPLSRLHYFVPIPIATSQLSDLCASLRDVRTAIGIFNEHLAVSDGTEGVITLTLESGAVLSCYELDLVNDILLEPIEDADGARPGTRISIMPHVFARLGRVNTAGYLRLRIRINPEDVFAFAQEYSSKDKKLFSSFERTEVVAFRVNERRNLPSNIVRSMTDSGSFVLRLRSVHYLLVRELSAELAMTHTDLHKCWMLEDRIWERYVQWPAMTSPLVIPSIAYHWKKTYPEKKSAADTSPCEYNAIAKFRTREVSVATVLVAIVIAIAVGALGSLLASAIWEYFHGP